MWSAPVTNWRRAEDVPTSLSILAGWPILRTGSCAGSAQIVHAGGPLPVEPAGPLSLVRRPHRGVFHDGTSAPVPQTHLMAAPTSLRIPIKFDPAFDPRRTEFLSRMVEKWSHFEGVLGMSDRRMAPLLRPGSIVLVDASVHKIDDGDWTTEHDRPMCFVELRDGYRCGWFHQEGSRLVMQPHPLSHCSPETWRV